MWKKYFTPSDLDQALELLKSTERKRASWQVPRT